MKLLRIAAVGAGLFWFLDPRRGPARRARAVESVRGLLDRARAMLEGSQADEAAKAHHGVYVPRDELGATSRRLRASDEDAASGISDRRDRGEPG
jgi:hypothetical protein